MSCSPATDASAPDYASTTPIVLNGGSITAAGQPFTPVLPAPGTSGSLSGDETLEITSAAPVATAIDCAGNQLAAGATSLQFTVNFSQPVIGVNASDFVLTGGNSFWHDFLGHWQRIKLHRDRRPMFPAAARWDSLLSITTRSSTPRACRQAAMARATEASPASNTRQLAVLLGRQRHGRGRWERSFNAADWRVGDPAGPMLTFVSGANAIFPASTGTVTVSGEATVNTIVFQSGSGAADARFCSMVAPWQLRATSR